jgi:GT2 family glycosyltransferase
MADRYAAAIVTFRRPDPLRRVLEGLDGQLHPPEVIVVADNDPERTAEPVVSEFALRAKGEVVYLPLGENLGPAGGWAAGVQHIASHPARGDWVAVFDDDDPIAHPEVMRRLARRGARASPDVAAIGMRGARLRRRSATLRPVVESSSAALPADYLASNGAPMYRWSTIDEVGFFDDTLFFGFEDLELGIRLRGRGLVLLVEPAADIHEVASTSTVRTPWREYYKTRALVVICRRHLGRVALLATLGRTLVAAAPRLLVRREGALLKARLQGARDGLADRLGPQAHAPTTNPTKPRVG